MFSNCEGSLAPAHQPLRDYVDGAGSSRGETGLNEVFVISRQQRDALIAADARSADIIKPFIQGTHLRPWYVEDSPEFLIFARRGVRIEDYPAVQEYLGRFRTQLEPKPPGWDDKQKWPGRKAGAYEWYELQDTVDYWQGFEQPKIVWPDISKLPRFSMDTEHRYLGNTGYIIPGGDYYLLGILSSWATWFFLSKTAQPLRLRGDRWQYRLIAQFMEQVPVPDAPEPERQAIANLGADMQLGWAGALPGASQLSAPAAPSLFCRRVWPVEPKGRSVVEPVAEPARRRLEAELQAPRRTP